MDPKLDTTAAALSRGVTLLFSVACGLAVANVYYAQPLLDRIADDFGISHAGAGLIITLTQVGYGLGLLLVVPLGDLIDRRRLIIGQSLLSVAALVSVALAASGAVLLISIALVGALAVVAQVLVAYAALLAHPSQRGRAVGAVTSGIVVGIVLARTIAGTVSDLIGWRAVYFGSAVATLLLVALLFRFLPRRALTGPRLPFSALIASMFQLFLEEPALRVRAVLALLIFAAVTTLTTPMVLPLVAPPLSLSHAQVGLFGLSGVAGAFAASLAGRWADRGHAQRTTAFGLALMAAAWLPAAMLGHSLWGLILGVIAIDFGLQSVHVSNQSLIYRVRPEAQSRLAGAYMIFYSIGCAIGSMISTQVYARAGWGGVCLVGVSISVLALVFWACTRHLTPEGAAPAAPALRMPGKVAV